MTSKTLLKSFFILLIPFSLFHFVRDVFQDRRVENITTEVFKMHKNWCGGYCNDITFPFEVFILVGSAIVVKRNKTGALGLLVIAVFYIWLAMFLYDYFVFNH